MTSEQTGIPLGATTVTVGHRVGFHETDAMGIVHHANYLRHFENARVVWLETHDRAYTEWIGVDLHFAVTRVEVDYRRPARFDDRIEITTWLEWVRGASLAMGYVIRCSGEILVTGRTEHASVNGAGRVRRLPRTDRERLARNALGEPDGPSAQERPDQPIDICERKMRSEDPIG
jgi:acyl-CoA thioester hydrolase